MSDTTINRPRIASSIYALRWRPVPETVPPRRADNRAWSEPVWLALSDGRVVHGDCNFPPRGATYKDKVHAWFAGGSMICDRVEVVAWMPFAVPDHPHALPAPSRQRQSAVEGEGR